MQFKKQILQLERTVQQTRKLYATALQVNLQKDLKLQQMKNELKSNEIKFDEDGFVPGEFRRFEGHYTEKQLRCFRSVETIKSKDSAFVSSILKSTYSDDLSVLMNKTVTGKGTSEELSPAKVAIMKSLFQERLDSIEMEEEEKTHRVQRFRTLLSKNLDRVARESVSKKRKFN